MAPKVGMVHVGCFNVRFFGQLAAEIVPDVEVVHFTDGGLPSMASRDLRPRVIERLRTLASFAEESGAQAVLLTCTAFGRLVDDVKGAVACPVLSALDLTVDEALKLQGTIGIIASHPGTLAGTSHILEEQAALEGKTLDIKTRLCPDAWDAMWRDDWPTHNRIILANLRELMHQVDAVVAPQPSVEIAVQELPESDRKVPMLTSPRLSVTRLKRTLQPTP